VGFVEVKTLLVDYTDIVDMHVVLKKLGTVLRQRRQDILLADIKYWQHIFTIKNAVVTVNKPTQQHDAHTLYKDNTKK